MYFYKLFIWHPTIFVFASWLGLALRPPKVRIRALGVGTSFMAYNIIHAREDYSIYN